jgi:hypothetical protein
MPKSALDALLTVFFESYIEITVAYMLRHVEKCVTCLRIAERVKISLLAAVFNILSSIFCVYYRFRTV